MNQHVSGFATPQKRVDVWTPWGVLKVADLDRALDKTAPAVNKRRRADKHADHKDPLPARR